MLIIFLGLFVWIDNNNRRASIRLLIVFSISKDREVIFDEEIYDFIHGTSTRRSSNEC